MNPVQITYRNVPVNPTLDALIQARMAKVTQFWPEVIDAHVVVEAPHRRHRTHNPYLLRVDLAIPGGAVVVTHTTDPDSGDDLASGVRTCFRAVERSLHEHAERRRGDRRRDIV